MTVDKSASPLTSLEKVEEDPSNFAAAVLKGIVSGKIEISLINSEGWVMRRSMKTIIGIFFVDAVF